MSPKQRLQLSPQIKDVAAMVQSGLFEYCCDVALLTLSESMGNPEDAERAACAQYQLVGARRILAILKDLATVPAEVKPNRIGQLNQL